MYSETQFWNTKYDLAFSLLYNPVNPSTRVMKRFLQQLLSAAIENGKVGPLDVDQAIKLSGVEELSDQDRGDLVIWMKTVGERYEGKLSRGQNEELRRLFELCDDLVNCGRLSAIKDIAALLYQ